MKRLYVPVWDGPVALTAKKMARLNAWRCDGLEEEDLVQEGYITFLKLSRKCDVYAAKHFMALFVVSFSRDLGKLATRSSARIKLGHAVPIDDLTVEDPGNWVSDVATILAEAPDEIVRLLSGIARDVATAVLPKLYSRRLVERETTDARLSRLVRRDGVEINLSRCVRDYLQNGVAYSTLKGETEVETWTVVRARRIRGSGANWKSSPGFLRTTTKVRRNTAHVL